MTFDELFDMIENAGVHFDRLIVDPKGEISAYKLLDDGYFSIIGDEGMLFFLVKPKDRRALCLEIK